MAHYYIKLKVPVWSLSTPPYGKGNEEDHQTKGLRKSLYILREMTKVKYFGEREANFSHFSFRNDYWRVLRPIGC